MFDQHANFGFSVIVTPPDPADSGTELEVTTGTGSWFPTPPFNVTVAPEGVLPLITNSEIVRVVDIVGDVFTIIRAQEGTTAKSIAAGWRLANTVTRKTIKDIEDAINDATIYYEHTQNSPSTTWTVPHNLDKFPNVTVVDSAGTQVEGTVEYQDSNTVVIHFSAAFSGKAYLS